MKGIFRLILILVLALSVTSCTKRYKRSRSEVIPPSPWPYHRGELSASGAVTGGTYGGGLDVLWEFESNDKPSAPLTIVDNCVAYPGARNKIKLINIETGQFRGNIKTKKNPQMGLAALDTLAFFAVSPIRNKLYCKNLYNGKTVWSRWVKDAVGGSIILDNRLIISSGNGIVSALDPATGDPLWTYQTESGFTASPSASGGVIFQPATDGTLYAVSADDGSEIFSVELESPLIGPATIAGDLFVGDVDGNVYGIDPESGSVKWSTQVEGPIWSGVAVDNGLVFVAHSGGQLVALDAATGRLRWMFEAGGVLRAAPTVVGDYVVAGTLTGTIHVLGAASGRAVNSRDLDEAIAFPVITDGNRIYVSTQKGRIICFGQRKESSNRASK